MTQVTGCAGALAAYETDEPLTPFERKYRDSGQALWRYVADLRAAVDEGRA